MNISDPDTWCGGFYELSVELSWPEDMQVGLTTIWSRPELDGCFTSRDREPAQQQRIAPSLAALETHGHLLGTALLPNGGRAVCGVCQVREETGRIWLNFYLPMGSLGRAVNAGGYPFENGRASKAWREPLENWLAGMGEEIFNKSPFRVGLVGFEVSGSTNSEEIEERGKHRGMGYLCPADGKLIWYRTNEWAYETDPV